VIHFLAPADERLFRNYLDVRGRSIAQHFEIVAYEQLPSRFRGGTYVFAALEQLSPAMERLVEELYAQLATCHGVRILNRPGRTLRRYELLTELARRGDNVFRAVRANADLGDLRYPVFLRGDRTHDGALSPLLHTRRDVESWIGRLVVIGRSLDELLVIEFCDTADAAGFYRKYAAFIIGDRIVPRSLDYGRHWMLKRQSTEYSRDMISEEFEYVSTNPHEAELREIFAIAGVDYGRIDYAIKDGRVQTWEINLHPTIGRGQEPSKYELPDDLRVLHQPTRELVHAKLREAWVAVDVRDDRELPVALDPALIAAAIAAPRPGHRSPLIAAVRKSLRPLKPLLLTRGAGVFRMLASWLRERRRPAG
jgi:hypothetical protein